jgi:hypothetical protein
MALLVGARILRIMSRSTNYSFTCPCGHRFESPIYEYVNTAKDPQLQYTILAGLLNTPTCPICGRKSALSNPFIYSDPAHGLLAYVHPTTDVPTEAKQLILEKLRSTYSAIEEQRENQAQETPPLQVIFGLDQLTELINSRLNSDEKLGRLALSTHSSEEAERGQMLMIARKLGSEMHCQVEVEDLPDEFTVWLYGSRKQIGALMRELAPREM